MYQKLLYGEKYGQMRSSDRFFEGDITSEKYLQMLMDSIISRLGKHSASRTMIWQQDGALSHYGRVVQDYLDDTFLQWIGRRGTVEWAPRSPDLTLCDFSLWGEE